ncbi:MAG TPA: MFS transporter, partial [Candidatus Udaeobacter sp.]|nr:MFS transporter [Candidatus Udaeobacter sp.]
MSQAVKEAIVPEEPVPPVVARGFRGFIAKFTVLKGAQRELWLTFLIKFLIYTAYSVTNKTMVLWLSKDLGFSDQAAGALVGWVWAPAMTIFTLLAGSLTDAIGLRRTFFLGVAICTVARSVMVVTTIPSLALACGVLPLAIGEALGTPVLLAATRRYSTTAQRSISFSIVYAVMNVGYVAAGYIFDYVRQLNLHVSLFGFEPTAYQQLFIVSLLFEIVLFPVIYFIRRGAEATNGGPVIDKSSRNRGTAPFFWSGLGAPVRKSAMDTAHLFRRLVGQSAFYRLLVFFLFIGFLKAIFLQMDYVFPKFGIRELGFDAPVGKLAAINAIIII